MNWTPEQEAEANKLGWGIVDVWDAVKQRWERAIVSKGSMTDEAANKAVQVAAIAGNKLQITARKVVFESLLAPSTKTKKGKTK